MRLPLTWLREFVAFREKPEQLAELLTLSGSEVEKIERGMRLDPKIIVGEIKTIIQHPTAERLKVTKVDVGKGQPLTIVCGAPNIKPGMKAATAIPGAKLPNSEKLEQTAIRGVESEGMLLAEDELSLGPDHSGIIALDTEATVGEPAGKWLGSNDVVFELDITPNRGDCLSILGLAREVAALTKRDLSVKVYELKESDAAAAKQLSVRVQDPKACPRYVARVVRGLHVGPSPQWMQSRLRAVGIRPVNNVVDVTNYVMMELGQPLHAFDSQKVGRKILVRRARRREKILTLDGKERRLEASDIVVTDGKRPIALAGVMGGQASEVTERTKEVILESAIFDPISIRRTARRENLRSEASARFERGIDSSLPKKAIDRAAALLQLIASGKVLKGQVSAVGAKPYLRPVIRTTPGAVNSILGSKLTGEEMVDLLHRLHLPASFLNVNPLTPLERKKVETRLATAARKFLGKSYEYGARRKVAFDCSSFLQQVFKQVGIGLPRTTVEQFNVGKPLKARSFQVGDLLFTKGDRPHYSTSAPNGVGHVGIYVGGGKVIQANSEQGVSEASLKEFTRKEFRGARRILGSEQPETLLVVTPTWRPDLKISADIAEEVGRLYGYNQMRPTRLIGELVPVKVDPYRQFRERVRDIMVGAGFTEVYTYSFYGHDSLYGGEKLHYRIVNPLNEQQRYLRLSLLQQIAVAAVKNSRDFPEEREIRLFEIGHAFDPSQRSEAREPEYLTFAWVKRAVSSDDFQLNDRQWLSSLLSHLKVNDNQLEYQSTGKSVGMTHQYIISPRSNPQQKFAVLTTQFDSQYKVRTSSLEVGLFQLFRLTPSRVFHKHVVKHPAIVRDLSVWVQGKYADLKQSILSFDPLVESVEGVNRYVGPDGRVSLAFRIIYRSAKRTLTGEEVKRVHDRITKGLVEKFNATPR